MANVSSMEELKRIAKEWTESEKNKDLIPIFLEDDSGSGTWYAPSKKNQTFRMGEIHTISKIFKEEKRNDLRTVHDLPLKILIFVPRNIASDEVIKIAKEKDEIERKNAIH